MRRLRDRRGTVGPHFFKARAEAAQLAIGVSIACCQCCTPGAAAATRVLDTPDSSASYFRKGHSREFCLGAERLCRSICMPRKDGWPTHLWRSPCINPLDSAWHVSHSPARSRSLAQEPRPAASTAEGVAPAAIMAMTEAMALAASTKVATAARTKARGTILTSPAVILRRPTGPALLQRGQLRRPQPPVSSPPQTADSRSTSRPLCSLPATAPFHQQSIQSKCRVSRMMSFAPVMMQSNRPRPPSARLVCASAAQVPYID